MKEESLLLLSDLQKLINQVVLIDYTIIILGRNRLVEILDENIVPCKDDLSGDLRLLASFGILVIIVICIFMVKN